jgi:hypothetical protein
MRLAIIYLLLLCLQPVLAQKKVLSKVNKLITAGDVEAHLSFLAADEMRGRDTGSPEIDIAANYLALQLKLFGAKPGAGASYFQDVQLEKIMPATSAELTIGADVLKLKDDLLFMSGGTASLEKEMIFIGYGTGEDFKKNEVKDKIVVAYAGTPTTKNGVQAILTDSPLKNQLAVTSGAAALIEIMTFPGVPWKGLVGFLSSERLVTRKDQSGTFPHLMMRNVDLPSIKSLQETKKSSGKLMINASLPVPVKAKNVVAIIEGTDDKLKQEWITISAHYDHVGVKKSNNNPDSIYNGARDNAVGTVALLQAAKFFEHNRPKRSVVLLAVTGEEKGLLGSEWYANHPLVPLNKTVFNLNCDGAGYNDTTIATVIDLNRTNVDALLTKACQTYGLGLKGDPAPEQNLYERSDNVNFAVKGIPSVNISPGVKAFDPELFKYYHQPADEVGSLNMHYLEKFFRAFVYASYLLASDPTRPSWKQGDKFEEAGKRLYSK